MLAQIPPVHETNEYQRGEQLFYGDPRFIVRIHVLRAVGFKVCRPFNLELGLRIATSGGREVGRTSQVSQNANAVWDETIYTVLGQRELCGGLVFSVMHYIQNEKEFTFALGELPFEVLQTFMATDGSHQTLLSFGENGKIKLEIEVTTKEDPGVLKNMVNWLTRNTAKKMTHMMTEQLCYDLRDRIHPITLNYKTPKLNKFFNKLLDTPTNSPKAEILSLEEQEEIEANLGAIFDFLNVNLEVLTSHMDEKYSMQIVAGIWARFLQVSEALIVPTLGNDPKDRKPWDDRRIKFFEQYIDVAHVNLVCSRLF